MYGKLIIQATKSPIVLLPRPKGGRGLILPPVLRNKGRNKLQEIELIDETS